MKFTARIFTIKYRRGVREFWIGSVQSRQAALVGSPRADQMFQLDTSESGSMESVEEREQKE
jgi:hypothetical protein